MVVLKLVPAAEVAQDQRAARVVAILEEALAEARKRPVRGIALIMLTDQGNHVAISPIEDNVKMLGAVELLKFDVAQNYREQNGD